MHCEMINGARVQVAHDLTDEERADLTRLVDYLQAHAPKLTDEQRERQAAGKARIHERNLRLRGLAGTTQ